MAISTTSQTVYDGLRNVIMQFTGRSDGSGQETNIVKVDVSAMAPPCDRVRVEKITYDVKGGVVELLWDAQTPTPFHELAQAGEFHYCSSPLQNSADDTASGDILLSTKGFELDSSYSITIEMKKKGV